MELSWTQAQDLVTRAIKDDLCDDEFTVPMDATLQELEFLPIDLADLLDRLNKACHGHSILSAKEKILTKNKRFGPFLRVTVWDIVRRVSKVYEAIPESAIAA